MTQDEIIKMAREAGGCEIGYGSTLWVATQSTEFLEAFAKLIAQRTWVGLKPTDWLQALKDIDPETKRLPQGFSLFACAIENKLKERNT
jgi:hypothetical protein